METLESIVRSINAVNGHINENKPLLVYRLLAAKSLHFYFGQPWIGFTDCLTANDDRIDFVENQLVLEYFPVNRNPRILMVNTRDDNERPCPQFKKVPQKPGGFTQTPRSAFVIRTTTPAAAMSYLGYFNPSLLVWGSSLDDDVFGQLVVHIEKAIGNPSGPLQHIIFCVKNEEMAGMPEKLAPILGLNYFNKALTAYFHEIEEIETREKIGSIAMSTVLPAYLPGILSSVDAGMPREPHEVTVTEAYSPATVKKRTKPYRDPSRCLRCSSAKTTAFIPCGHLRHCLSCASKVLADGQRCDCYQFVDGVLQVYN